MSSLSRMVLVVTPMWQAATMNFPLFIWLHNLKCDDFSVKKQSIKGCFHMELKICARSMPVLVTARHQWLIFLPRIDRRLHCKTFWFLSVLSEDRLLLNWENVTPHIFLWAVFSFILAPILEQEVK